MNATVMTVPLRYSFAISVVANEIFNNLIVSFLQILISVKLCTSLVLLLLFILVREVASSPPVAPRVLRGEESRIPIQITPQHLQALYCQKASQLML